LDNALTGAANQHALLRTAPVNVRPHRGPGGSQGQLSTVSNPARFRSRSCNSGVLRTPWVGKLLEADLEWALLDNLQAFLLELGRGFAFIARQYRISSESKDFYIDLVFYNYLLKCFVLFDLKSGELNHQDIGQMDMYVRMMDDLKRTPDDNPTVGIILCTQKDASVVRYSVLHENEQLFASRYKLVLPSEEELRKELERDRAQLSNFNDLEDHDQQPLPSGSNN